MSLKPSPAIGSLLGLPQGLDVDIETHCQIARTQLLSYRTVHTLVPDPIYLGSMSRHHVGSGSS